MNEPRVSELHVRTTHDAEKRPDTICVYCGELLVHGDPIVGMPVAPKSPRWQNRQWHEDCFLRRFAGRIIPRETRFSPVTVLVREGR